MQVIASGSPVTELVDSTRFTGRVWRTDYIEAADADALSGVRFLYEPGARSFWHVHEHEQAIIAVFGSGLVCWEGLDRPRTLEAGDWWHVEPGVAHWHGATPHTPFAHLAVTAGGATHWQHEVADHDYLAGPSTG